MDGDSRAPATVLIVDDDPDIRALLRDALEEEGYVIREAEDGEDALEQARLGGVDLVITDVVMPERDGIETMKALRRELPRLAFVAMSGTRNSGYLRMAKLLGASGVLGKPFAMDAVVETVRKALGREP